MSSTVTPGTTADSARPATIDMKLEVITVPVADLDRAKAFYANLGWRVDADISPAPGVRVVQITPTHSEASISFTTPPFAEIFGVKHMEPGSQQRLELVVSDIEAAREDLISRGVDVGELFHLDGGRIPGPHPQRASYGTYATFSDPDGNTWLLQEVTDRLPGRTWDD
jgi:catechol 2,3-dioxygenase-like lactoylglutathione lyase family enzyme